MGCSHGFCGLGPSRSRSGWERGKRLALNGRPALSTGCASWICNREIRRRRSTVPLTDEARAMIEAFGREMQQRQTNAGGLLQSALGKAARPSSTVGAGVRNAVVVRRGRNGGAASSVISARAFAAAATFPCRTTSPRCSRAGLRRCRRYRARTRRGDTGPLDIWPKTARSPRAPPAAGGTAVGPSLGRANSRRCRCVGRSRLAPPTNAGQ